jgi:radical SAM protein with 4Fe4S-binding SPASM domain
MELNTYPVLKKEMSISKVITGEEMDILVYNTKKGTKAYLNDATYEFAKRCRGIMTLEEILYELSEISGESFEKIQKDLQMLITKIEPHDILLFLPSPLSPPRAEPCEVHLYSRIENISLEITRKCNLQCKHCYSDSGVQRKNELTFEEIKKLIDQLAHIGVLNILLTGGEPLLHPRLFEIIEYIVSKPMSCTLFTNGTLITKAVAQKLKRYGVLSVVTSIDGATPATHDTFRGVPNSFEKTVQGIHLLRETGIPVRGNISIHKGNCSEVVDIVELFKASTVEDYRISPTSFSGRPEKCDICITPKEYRAVLKKLKQYESEHGKIKREYSYPQSTNCGIGTSSLAIRSNGNVVPCPGFPDEVLLGNIREDSLGEIWNNSEFLIKGRHITVFESDMCKKCTHANVCRGGCLARIYARTGIFMCGDIYECAYFTVYDDYTSVKAGKQFTPSVKIQ